MTARLVLGCGAISQALIDGLADRPGDLAVADADESAIRTLREDGITAEVVDLTDPEALAGVAADPDTVAVALGTDGRADGTGADCDRPTTLDVALAARHAFPDAFLLVYDAGTGDGGVQADADRESGEATPERDGPATGADHRGARDDADSGGDEAGAGAEQLGAVADEVVRPLAETTAFLMDRIGDAGVRTRKLTSILRGLDGPLAIVTHDNPDPDAIASAVALDRIAGATGLETEVCYYGEITHQENRAFVNLLEYDLTNLDPDSDLSRFGGFALVDHSRPGVNDGLPEDTRVDIVIDHHPPRLPVDARFVDLRSEVGATSTLLVDYLRHLGITPTEAVATGLLFGIHVDTDEFTREVSPTDFEAAAFLQPHADLGTLERIESPSMSADTLDTIARAIANRQRHGPVLVSGVGRLTDRDALAQAADRLLTLEDVTTTFVYGISDGTVFVSARARGTDVDLGETLREAFGQIGSAGGHADMAGAQLSLGLLDDTDAGDESLVDIVDDIVTDRFLDAIESRTNRVIRDVYPDDFHGVENMDASALALDDVEVPLDDVDGDPEGDDAGRGDVDTDPGDADPDRESDRTGDRDRERDRQ